MMKPCCCERNWPKERGPTETLPGRKAETDRVCEGISEGFRLAESGRVAPRGPEANGSRASRPHHLQWLLVFLQRLQHRQENQLPVVIAQDRFRAAFRMRHHAQHIALGIADPGD